VKEVVMGGACNIYGGEILTNILVGTPGRSTHRREDNVAVDLKKRWGLIWLCVVTSDGIM